MTPPERAGRVLVVDDTDHLRRPVADMLALPGIDGLETRRRIRALCLGEVEGLPRLERKQSPADAGPVPSRLSRPGAEASSLRLLRQDAETRRS